MNRDRRRNEGHSQVKDAISDKPERRIKPGALANALAKVFVCAHPNYVPVEGDDPDRDENENREECQVAE